LCAQAPAVLYTCLSGKGSLSTATEASPARGRKVLRQSLTAIQLMVWRAPDWKMKNSTRW